MRTQVIFKYDDQEYQEYKEGDVGYIDGYLANNGKTFMVIIVQRTKKPTLVRFGNTVEVVNIEKALKGGEE